MIIEFKKKDKTIDEAINQVFLKGYYTAFETGNKNKYILAIHVDSKKSPIITDHMVLKYDGKGEIHKKTSWNEQV